MAERTGAPYFIFDVDVQLHYVGAGYGPGNAEAGRKGAVTKQALLGLRRQSRRLLNAARLFNADVSDRRNEIPKDYLSRMKMSMRLIVAMVACCSVSA